MANEVSFIDAHDREIISWRAVMNAGISGSEIRDMMLEAVEQRFAAFRAPQPVEIPSDNASLYIARETRILASQLGLKPCFTPAKSPQSTGIPEAFVKTLKRGHVHVPPPPDATTLPEPIAGWVGDCNDNHPQSGLKMPTPCEFIAAQTATARVSGEKGARPGATEPLRSIGACICRSEPPAKLASSGLPASRPLRP